jgi:hypothetical protein
MRKSSMKISKEVSTLLERMNSFSNIELQQIKALAAFCLSNKDQKRSQQEIEFFEAFREQFASMRVHVPHDWLDKTRSGHHVTWDRHLETLGPLLDAFKLKSGTPQAAHGVYRLLWSLLIDDMGKGCIPISLRSVINNMGRIPEVFEKELPTYNLNGQALVAKRMARWARGGVADAEECHFGYRGGIRREFYDVFVPQ